MTAAEIQNHVKGRSFDSLQFNLLITVVQPGTSSFVASA